MAYVVLMSLADMKIFTTAALLATALVCNAIPLNYEIGSGSTVSANSADPGLKIKTQLSSTLTGTSFTLNDGESTTFQFFKIWADEGSVESDDLAQKQITASIDFSSPSVDANFTGLTFGANINLLYDKATVTWDAPALITLSDRTFSITLSNLEFSKGSLLDFDLGDSRKWVTATLTQVSSSVPDGGSTAVILGLSLCGMSMLRRKLA
jgi:hypothetical protein